MASGCIVGVIDLDDDDWSNDAEATRLVNRSVPVTTQIGLRITGLNGNIEVFAVDGDHRVTVQARKRVRSHSVSDAEAHLSRIQIEVETTPDEVQVKTVHIGDPHGRTYTVDYEVFVPTGFYVAGNLSNGNTRIEDLLSWVALDVANGNVILKRVEGSAWVNLGNGIVDATVYPPVGGEIVFSVGNGSAILTVPQDVSAELKAQVGNGTITVQGLSLIDPVSGPNTFRGTLGSGAGLIDLTVGNGTIRVNGA
jgi:hypothetical protein